MARVGQIFSFGSMISNFPFLSLFLAALTLLWCGQLSAEPKTHFVIDAGHGGIDPGTQQNGLDEKDLTLDLAKRVKKVLEDRNFTTTLTRETDIFVELTDRAAVANKIPNSVFISLHFNSHSNRTVQGIETFYWPGSEQGQKLASFIQGELNRRIVTRDRGFKPGQFKVLRETKGTAALVECGFISNRWEAQRCKSSWFKQVLAEEIAQALIRYSCPQKSGDQASVEKNQEPVAVEKKAPVKIETVPVSPIYPVSKDN